MRKCRGCGTELNACMGFVKAGDLLLLWNNQIKPENVRELCGKCVEMYRWNEEGELVECELPI